MRSMNARAFSRRRAVALLAACLLMTVAAGQARGELVLTWSSIDGGGGMSSGGPYLVTATIGQADAGSMSGGEYEVRGGFWLGGPVCFVEFDDFAKFADYWLATGAGLPADLYEDGSVDWLDLREFAYDWLYECPYDWPLR